MAAINFVVKTKNNPSQIYIRFSHGREIDCWASSNLLINPKFWDQKRQRLRTTKQTPEAIIINTKLEELRGAIITGFTLSYASGLEIDSAWLDKTIKEHFNRPAHEIGLTRDKTAIYFHDFLLFWLENIAPEYRNANTKRKLSENRIGYLTNFAEKIQEYQDYSGKKLRLSDLNPKTADEVMTYFDIEMDYANSVVSKLIATYNFFCRQAILHDRNVPQNYHCLYKPVPKKQIPEPYLSEDEILKIFDYDFSDNDRLDNARDNFIIGLCTGLRVSDFLNRLRIDNISDGFIEIQTQKTGALVALPIHWMVRETLNKRLGLLPRKISDVKFNLYIKEVCQIVGIDNEIPGNLFDAKTNRNKPGLYPKWMLVSSHICRRSFATNNFEKISHDDLMRLGGWSSLDMMFRYIKKTSRDSAIRLSKAWEKDRKKIKPKNIINDNN